MINEAWVIGCFYFLCRFLPVGVFIKVTYGSVTNVEQDKWIWPHYYVSRMDESLLALWTSWTHFEEHLIPLENDSLVDPTVAYLAGARNSERRLQDSQIVFSEIVKLKGYPGVSSNERNTFWNYGCTLFLCLNGQMWLNGRVNGREFDTKIKFNASTGEEYSEWFAWDTYGHFYLLHTYLSFLPSPAASYSRQFTSNTSIFTSHFYWMHWAADWEKSISMKEDLIDNFAPPFIRELANRVAK